MIFNNVCDVIYEFKGGGLLDEVEVVKLELVR